MSKIIRRTIYVIATLMLFAACDTSNDDVDIITKNEFSSKDIKALNSLLYGNSISESEVVSKAESFMNMFDQPNSSTRSASRRVSEVIPAVGSNILTRSLDEEGEDTLAYIINFADDMGYVFASADRRTDFIMAISPEGNINPNVEDMNNSGIEVFFANLEGAYNRQIQETEAIKSELLKDSTLNLEQNIKNTKAAYGDELQFDFLTFVVNKIVGPFVTVGWRQTSPYNDNAPLINGERATAGCVSVAVAQMLSYYYYPETTDWTEMIKYPIVVSSTGKAQVAELFRWIGDGINTHWDTFSNGGSGALVSDVDNFFSSIFFGNPGVYAAYDSTRVFACLDKNIPVIMSGFSLKETYRYKTWFLGKTKTRITYKGGHAWLVDGYMDASCSETIKIGDWTYYYFDTKSFLHCNWGDGIAPNGYYAADAFDYYYPITRSSTTIDGTEGYYQFKLEALYDADPRGY